MGNKMFVVGGYENKSCEVFDSYSRKFTKINSETKVFNSKISYFYAFGINNNILVFQNFLESLTETVVYLYDIDKEKWSNVQCDFTKNMFRSSFVKYYT